MLSPVSRRVTPFDEVSRPRLSPLDANLDAPDPEGGSDASPGLVPQITRLAPPSGPAPGATQPQAMPDTSGVGMITQLPDGAGGAVSVPPVALAPSSVAADITPSIPITGHLLGNVPGVVDQINATPQTPADAPAPWEAAAPGTFTADDNAINSVVAPAANPRLLHTQGLSDEALQSVLHGPDRLALAKQYFDADVLGLNRQYEHDQTDALNEAGAHGQLGSGMLTNRYGDLLDTITEKKTAAGLRYLTDAATGTIGDRLNAYDAASGAEGRVFNEGVSDRGELRTERGYQADLAQRALAARIAQQAAESGANQQSFDNALSLFRLGSANNPTSAYETAAGQATSEAGGTSASMQELIRALLARQAGG